jgi:release factor glutamine methyltransferase
LLCAPIWANSYLKGNYLPQNPISSGAPLRIDPCLVFQDCDEVYAPREDTFLLIKAIEVSGHEKVLEIGCGSGLVSLHLAKAGAEVWAVDVNPAAVECTRRAAAANHIPVQVGISDLFSEVRGRFDLIVFNPPYLKEDEHPLNAIDRSWAGGRTGTEVLGRFLREAPDHLAPDARILVVVSSHMDQQALAGHLEGYQQRMLLSERIFFEELRVLELRCA